MKNILEKIDWVFISKFGKNNYVKRTYVFLVLVPFVVNAANKLGYEKLIESIPFSWHMFFYSAVFFTLGTVVYNIYAPPILKENDSFKDFLGDHKTWSHIKHYYEYFKFPEMEYLEIEKNYEQQTQRPRSWINREDLEKFLISKNTPKRKQAKFLALHSYYYGQKEISYYSSYGASMEYAQESKTNVEKHLEGRNEKNDKYNLKYAFWELFKYARKHDELAMWCCAFFIGVGTILLSIVMINSICVVVESGFTVWIDSK